MELMLENKCGIYGLFLKGTSRVVYIGKTSRSFSDRWNEHRGNGYHNEFVGWATLTEDYEFREVESYPLNSIEDGALREREDYYIKTFNPSFNIIGRTGGFPLPSKLQALKGKYDLILFENKDFIAPNFEDDCHPYWTYQIPSQNFSHSLLISIDNDSFYVEPPVEAEGITHIGLTIVCACLIAGVDNFIFPPQYRRYLVQHCLIDFSDGSYNEEFIDIPEKFKMAVINKKGEIIDLGIKEQTLSKFRLNNQDIKII